MPKYMIETYRASAMRGPRAEADRELADPDGYVRATIGPVEAETAEAALRAHAAGYIGSSMTSVAKRYGGEPFVDQAHGQSNRAGRVGAQAVRVGFTMQETSERAEPTT